MMIEGYRLSPQQSRLWSLQQNSHAYRVQLAILLEGSLRKDLLKRSLEALPARHEILRATFHRRPGMDAPLQALIDRCRPAWSEEDLSDLPVEWQEVRVAEAFRPESFHLFDFERGPILHSVLFALSRQRHVLVVSLPALCADSWTARNLFVEVGRAYAGATDPEPDEESAQYTQFAEWQRELLEESAAEEGRRFWRLQELDSLCTMKIPFEVRPAAGSGFDPRSLAFNLGPDLSSRLDRLAADQNAPISAALLACWQSLWWRLTDEAEVTIGSLSPGRKYDELRSAFGLFARYLPLRSRVENSLRFTEVLKHALESQRVALAWEEYFILESGRERPGGSNGDFYFPIAFDFDEEPASYTAGGVSFSLSQEYSCIDRFKLKLSAVRRGHSLSATLHYDLGFIQPESVAVLARYFETFVKSVTESPDARISDLEILSEADRRQLLIEFNQTSTGYPEEKRVHQLFEQQVERGPDRIAAIFGDRQLTYADLNRRSNQVAYSLIDRGVGAGATVGLYLERSLEMLIGLLGILKAGGAYLPLDPELPKSRIEYQIAEARCPVLLAQKSLLGRLPDFGGEVECLDDDEGRFDGLPVDNPATGVPSQALAYVIYTSGSTGQPKGVAIAHRSLINYVHSICERFGLRRAAADQQLSFATVSTIAADLGNTAIFPSLLTGGRLHVTSYEATTDGDKFARYFSERSIDVLKIVPSHLSGLTVEGSPTLPARCLILGGEALSYELASSLAANGGGEVMNHYGPTETTIGSLTYSFSRNRLAPRLGASVPIGRPIANTETYILDERLNPAPLGVAGEVYIGGDGVAQCYLNKPEQTAARFIPDPWAVGERMYQTGDLARYLPDGNVEFLGRADSQLKIHGYRIEPGEIEAALNGHPAVKESSVIAREDEAGRKRLVAYIVPNQAEASLNRELQSFLRRQLPIYMLPSAIVTLKSMPLTPNGKLDRHRLPAPDSGRPDQEPSSAPRTSSERILTEIWKSALRVEQVGIHDNFFELGGDSILSLQIVAKANRAGLRVTHKQLFEHPTIADLANVAGEEETIEIEQGAVTGSVPLTPIQRWFFERNLRSPHHWNMGLMLEVWPPCDARAMERAVRQLVEHHDALRLRFVPVGTEWRQLNAGLRADDYFLTVDLSGIPASRRRQAIEQCGAQLQTSLNLSSGPLLRVSLIDQGPDLPGRLIVALHHLVVDGISWRILLSDLQTAYDQISNGQAVRLPAKTTSFKQWAEFLSEYAQSDALRRELSYWLTEVRADGLGLKPDHPDGVGLNVESSAQGVVSSLTPDETRALLQEVPAAYHTQVNDALLTALVQAFAEITGERSLLVELEGHGREPIIEKADLSRTVGWFTTHFPVLLDLSWASGVGDGLKLVKEQLRRVSNHGIGYGLLRYLCADAEVRESMAALPRPQISFNYLGQFDQELSGSSRFKPAREALGPDRSPEAARSHLLRVNAGIIDGCLRINWGYSSNVHDRSTIEDLARKFGEALRSIITHCRTAEAGGYTPSDFSEPGLRQHEMDLVTTAIYRVSDTPGVRPGSMFEDMYSLSPLQEGMLFHSLSSPESDAYFRQMSFTIRGSLNVRAFESAWRRVVDRHTALRTSFFWQGINSPLQIVFRQVTLKLESLNWRGLGPSEQAVRLEEFCRAEKARGFDLSRPPLMRLALIETDEDSHQVVWSYHHLIMDAWSRALIYQEVINLYEAECDGRELRLEPARPYSDYITWLRKQSVSEAETFWRRRLAGFNSPTPVGSNSIRDAGWAHEGRSAVEEVRIPVAGASELKAFAQQHGLTLNTMVQGAWALLLSCYSGEQDVAFGTVVSGRPADLKRVESIVGLFINTLVMRVQVQTGSELVPWLRQIQHLQAEMSQYESSRLVDLQRWSGLPGGAPLFESVLSFANHPLRGSADSSNRELEIAGIRFGEDSHYPLGLEVAPGSEVSMRVIYDNRRYETGFIIALLARLVGLLQAFPARPQGRLRDLRFLTADETAPADGSLEILEPGDIDAQFTF